MRGVSKLKGGLMMIEYTFLHRRSCSAPTILQLVVLSLFIFSTSCCSSTSLPSPASAGKLLQDKGGFQLRRLAHINLSTAELLQEIISKNQNLDAMRNNIMGERPRKLMVAQLRTREQEIRAQNAQIMGSLYHHKLTMKPAQRPVYGKVARRSERPLYPKVSIKPAQLIHQGGHDNATPPSEKAILYQKAYNSRKPSQFNGAGQYSCNDLDAASTVKPALLYEEKDNVLHHEGAARIEVSSQSHVGAPLQIASHDHMIKEIIRPGAVSMHQLHEEFYRRGRSALQVELLERQKAMVMTRTRARKELHRDHAGDQRAFHADYAEAHPHPPRNN